MLRAIRDAPSNGPRLVLPSQSSYLPLMAEMEKPTRLHDTASAKSELIGARSFRRLGAGQPPALLTPGLASCSSQIRTNWIESVPAR
jgi:hypothetical protein